MEEDMFCYIHEGSELTKSVVGSVKYKGGTTNCIVVSKNISYFEFVSKVCGELNLEPNSIKLEFTVKFNPLCLLLLHDDTDILKIFKLNMFCHAYVSQCTEVDDGLIAPTRYILLSHHHILFKTRTNSPSENHSLTLLSNTDCFPL